VYPFITIEQSREVYLIIVLVGTGTNYIMYIYIHVMYMYACTSCTMLSTRRQSYFIPYIMHYVDLGCSARSGARSGELALRSG